MTTVGIIPIREEKIEALLTFSCDLAAACHHCGFEGEKASQAIVAAVTGECVKCHIHVRGDELLAVSTATLTPNVAPKIRRLSLGYCARDGCESLAYRIEFHSVPEIDCEKLQSYLESARSNRMNLASAEQAVRRIRLQNLKLRSLLRLAVMFSIVLLVLCARQWYLGGRIPFVREPEKFRVTPATVENVDPNE